VRGTIAIAVVVVLGGCSGSDRGREIGRIRAHLERVERELRASTPTTLNADQARRRALVIDHLHRYIEAERYPENHVSDEMTPIFIDRGGARCAMAAVLEASGQHALVERIARTHNLAYIEELKDDPELAAWLNENGLTLIEAARIQPAYANTVASRWQPTGSLLVEALAGGTVNVGPELVLGAGARVGARRVTESNSSCDHCVYSTMAWIAEYRRAFVFGGRSTNLVGLLMQYDLNQQAGDHQLYLIGGPVLAIDDDAHVGGGGQAGLGFSLRRRAFPFFAELIASALARSGSAALHGGFNAGVVW
jgi:hypothetical protein